MILYLLAIVVQLFASVQAWRLAQTGAGGRRAWLVIGSAIFLMTATRVVSLLLALHSPTGTLTSLLGIIELAVSLLLAIGLSSLPGAMAGQRRVDAAARAAEESEARFHHIIETSLDGVWIVDAEGRTTYTNRRMGEMLGTTPAEMLGTHVFEYMKESEQARATENLARRASGIREQHEFEFMTVDGGVLHCLIASNPIMSANGVFQGAVSFVSDITSRRATEDALRESEERFGQFAEQSSQVFWFTQLTPERVLYVSPAYETIWGRARAALYQNAQEWIGAIVPEDRERVHQAWTTLVASAGVSHYDVEYRIHRPDGTIRWIHDRGTLIRDRAGAPVQVAGIAADMTARHQAERAALGADLQFRSLVEASPLAIVALTASGDVMGWTPAAQRVFGWSRDEVIDRPLPIVPPTLEHEHRRFREEVLRGEAFSGRLTQRRHKDGTLLDVTISTAPILDSTSQPTGLVAIYEDVTARRQLEERERQLQQRLIEAQKLESLGVLAGGIAHDFNNLLTIVQGNAQLAQAEVSPASSARDSLQQIEAAVARAADLTAQMLTYAGKGQFQVRPLSLARLVTEQSGLIERLVPHGATLRIVPEIEASLVAGDSAQLRQLLITLVTNAVESLPPGTGTIQITTGTRQLDDVALGQSLYSEQLRPGRYVYLEVSDTGSGMDQETLARMFEPFFTSRFAGRGLGLAAVAGIVRRHHGTVTVESVPGRGTTVTLLLPVAIPIRPRRLASAGSGSAGTILMVDDEKDVLRLMGKFLELAGFEVVLASGGAEALDQFHERMGEIDVVVLDLTMPGMSGEQTLAALRELDPDLPAIVTSGYNKSEVARRCAGLRISAFLMKPYLPAELTQQVREVLTADRPHPAGSPGRGSR